MACRQYQQAMNTVCLCGNEQEVQDKRSSTRVDALQPFAPPISNIEHTLLEISMHTIPPGPERVLVHALLLRLPISGCRRRCTTRNRRLIVRRSIQKDIEVAPTTLARNIGIVRWRDQADRLRSARVEITRGVGTLLQCVRVELILVVDYRVVRRPDVTL